MWQSAERQVYNREEGTQHAARNVRSCSNSICLYVSHVFSMHRSCTVAYCKPRHARWSFGFLRHAAKRRDGSVERGLAVSMCSDMVACLQPAPTCQRYSLFTYSKVLKVPQPLLQQCKSHRPESENASHTIIAVPLALYPSRRYRRLHELVCNLIGILHPPLRIASLLLAQES